MRHSILLNHAGPMLTSMRLKMFMLMLHESDLDVMRLLHSVIGATQDAVTTLDKERAHLHPFAYDTTNNLTLAIPVDKWVGLERQPTDMQDQGSRLYGAFGWTDNTWLGQKELSNGRLLQRDAPLPSFETFVKVTMAYKKPDPGHYWVSPQGRQRQRILCLPLVLKHPVPVQYRGEPGHDETASCRNLCLVTRDGPYGFTNDEWQSIQRDVTAIHDKIVEMNYLHDIGRAVAGWCTTPGIIKRVWPDAINFMPPGNELRTEVEQASPSALPVGLRRRLVGFSDSMGPEGAGYKELTESDLCKVTSKVTDAILASQLMPDPGELCDRRDDGYNVRSVQINQLIA